MAIILKGQIIRQETTYIVLYVLFTNVRKLLKKCSIYGRDEMVDKTIQEELAFQEAWLLWNREFDG